MQIDVTVQDANNILCEVTPPQPEIIVIDRGVEGNGIVSIVPVTISTFQYLRITYTNGTVQDVGPLTSTAYTATAPITIVGNTISLATVPIASGGTDATTAAGAIQNLLPSYTGNANKRLGLNSGATALEWVTDGGGTVTSINASGGTTGLSFTGGPITSSGTLTLGGTLAIANGGTGQTTANAAFNALAPSQTGNSGKYLTTDGSNTSWATNPLGTVTSVAATVPSFLSVSGSPITTSGTLAFSLSGTALPTTSGGTGLTSFTSGGVVYASSTSALTTGSAFVFDGTNIGLGITPSAWGSGYKAIDIGGGGRIYEIASNGSIGLDFNAFNNGTNWVYQYSTYASRYELTNGGQFQWHIAPSGTGGNAVSFTQAMTLTENGNLFLGTTSQLSNSLVSIVKNQNLSHPIVALQNLNAGTGSRTMMLFSSDTATGQIGTTSSTWTVDPVLNANETYVYNAYGIALYTGITSGPIRFLTNSTERGRFSGDGNFGIGTTTPAVKIHSQGQSNAATIELLRLSNIGSGANTASQLTFWAASTNYADIIGGYGASAPRLSFNVASGGYQSWAINGSDKLFLNTYGHFGVGTTSPVSNGGNNAALVHISTATVDGWAINHYTNGTTGFNSADGLIVGNIALDAYIFNYENANVIFGTSASEKARITASGDFGIGTTSPGQKLEVSSGDAVTRIAITNTANAVNGSGLQFLVKNGATTVSNVTIRADNADNIQFFNIGGERARITSGGNLLLGTTSDQGRKLQVSGQIALVDAALNSIADISINSSGVMAIAPYNGSGSAITFSTNPSGSGVTERARISSTGQLLVGQTTSFTGTSTISERGYASTGNGSLVQNRTGGYLGSVSNLVLFTRGNGSAQAWAFITISTIYATPSAFVSRTVVMVRGDMTYSVISQVGDNSNGYNAISFSVSGNDFRVSNSNGSIYFSIECELGSPNNASFGWNATWGSSW